MMLFFNQKFNKSAGSRIVLHMDTFESSHKTCSLCKAACNLLHAPWIPKNHLGIPLLRLCSGGMLLTHGYPKLLMLLNGQGGAWADPLGIGPFLSLTLCVFAEFACSIAVMLGFMTRMAALILVINFVVVVFVVNRQLPWDKAELGALYLVCFAVLLLTGAGRYSLDHLMRRLYRRCDGIETASCEVRS